MIKDTIAAISTPLGEGGIAVIRISGEQAVQTAEAILHSKIKLSQVSTHTVQYGHIVDRASGERVEEVLVTVMLAPRSFTMEDVVEISCHGGLVAVRRVLELVLASGARLAEPGEFTKRAFLNGRIDLTQAEAVMDLIRSKSDRASRIALKQMEGSLSKRIRGLRSRLLELMAHIEVNIDYPEHDVEELTSAHIQTETKAALTEIEALLRSAEQGKILREGLVTAIVGRPNVGKSSLLNALARENKAIVTEIPGTTRDVIEEYVTVNGIPLKLLDTAGIRETTDIVEQIGVSRSREALEDADLVLLVVNGAEQLQEDDRKLLSQLRDKQTLVLVNKTDLPLQLELAAIKEMYQEQRIILLSVQEEQGLDRLEQAISALFFSGSVEAGDMTYVSNVRHIHLLKRTLLSLEEALNAAQAMVPIDLVQIDIRNAWEQLGEIIGDSAGESLIDQIFSQFCLGK
ncbi:MAG: tRNA modification GTPase TrmE [Paenibacillaceae bacterium]|jgi:tRNA modification GTPase|nr:tRNA modification GTPase TrmE [Paenibacillaceae bacterium]